MEQNEKQEYMPAFPLSTIDGYSHDGMTLRDYFAAKALQGHLASEYYTGMNSAPENISGICEAMYLFADGMLKERNKQ